ncbi:hypothetical protein Efla_005761 [Eimeria flavescens]
MGGPWSTRRYPLLLRRDVFSQASSSQSDEGRVGHPSVAPKARGGASPLVTIERKLVVAPGDRLNFAAPLLREEESSGPQQQKSRGEADSGSPVVWMLPTGLTRSRIFAHGSSLLEGERVRSTSNAKRGTALLAKLDASFKAALQNPLQVSASSSAFLRQMQDGACRMLWGKKEIVTKQQNRSLLAKPLNMFSACPETKFTSVSAGETATWRQCANKLSQTARFFSWVRPNNSTTGSCTLLGLTSASVTEEDIANCLNEAKAEETAVSGYAGDAYCTSCLVGEWSTTACSTWCEAGMLGRYREIVQHENLEYCRSGSDVSCDKCPHLWETASCNEGVKCGQAIQPGKHYCPDAQSQSSRTTNTWQECSKACLSSFGSSGGIISDPSTFTDASCFRYAFDNTTATCEMKPLAECGNPATTTDALWISGDVLNLPSADFSTVEWSAWSPWSSCEGVDVNQGWKKRRRDVPGWGFRNDGLDAESQLIEVASCAASDGAVESAAAKEAMNVTCCLFGELMEWSEVECYPVCGTDRYQIRKKRRLQNPVPSVHNQLDPTCSAEKCKAEGETAESRKCIDVPECTSDCTYLEWTAWTVCACTDPATGIGSQMRTRRAVSGTICPDMREQQECTKESTSNVYVYVASAGVAGLVLILGLCAYRWHSNSEGQQAVHYETL